MNKITVIGGSTWDVMLTTHEALLTKSRTRAGLKEFLGFEYGSKIDTSQAEYTFGGGGANVAVGLSRLGMKAHIVTRVGKDWRGREIVEHLKKDKVKVGAVQYDRKLLSAVSLIVTAGGANEHVAFVDRGATINLEVKNYGTNEWTYVTSLANSKWPSMMSRLLTREVDLGNNVFWNPGSLQLKQPTKLKPLLKYVTVLDLNRAEGEKLTRDLRLPTGSIKNILTSLYKLGCKIVIITSGRIGAYCYDGKKYYFRKSFKLKPTNTIGAGDAFGSGWLAGFIHSGGSIKKAMDWGMANSNSVIMKAGAQKGLLNTSEINKFVRSR